MHRTTPGHARLESAIWLRLTLAAFLLLAFTLLAAQSAGAISRNDVLARAQRRVDYPVPYSQLKYYAGYRTDCSGYVSMCWATGTSWATMSFHNVTHGIKVTELEPGDALLKPGYHIRLFYAWLDEEHTQYVAYESGYGTVAVARIHSIADDLAFGYKPVRYDRISTSPAPRNVLKNGGFNTWARAWSTQPLQPVWWQTTGPWGMTVTTRRTDTYTSARSSLELSNPSADPTTFTTLSQSVPIVPGADYRVTVQAKSAYDPRGIELRLTYLDALGASLAETATTGDTAGVNPVSWSQMSMLASAPPEAARAVVSVRLAGGSSTDASGTVTFGTSLLLDGVSLARPQISASIKPSTTTTYRGRRITLSGTVSPTAAIDTTATLYVKRPGGTWQKVSSAPVYASGSGAAWKATYRFSSSMPRGTYRFRAKIARVPGYLGTTTGSASVRLK